MLAKNMAMSTRCFKKKQPKILSGLICEKFWSWNYFELSTIQDQPQLSSFIRLEMGQKNIWKVIAFSIENTFFPFIFCIFSQMNLKQIIYVLDDENQLVQNRW